MSDIADIEIDVNAHLWYYATNKSFKNLKYLTNSYLKRRLEVDGY
jgi:hypothetical protein